MGGGGYALNEMLCKETLKPLESNYVSQLLSAEGHDCGMHR